MIKGWYSAEPRRLPTQLEKVSQITLEHDSSELVGYLMQAMMRRAYFLGQEYKPPVYRRWGVPNG